MKIEEKLLKICKSEHLTIAFVESCTGGALAARFTKIPGASACFAGSLVAYQNRIKTAVLGIPGQLLQKFGAVSFEVADAMFEKCISLFAADVAVSVTGNAGPTKDEKNSSVGTVYIVMRGIFLGVKKLSLQLAGDREEVINQTVEIIFENLISILEGKVSRSSREK